MRKYLFALLCILPLILLAQSEDSTLIKKTNNYSIFYGLGLAIDKQICSLQNIIIHYQKKNYIASQ